MAVKKAKEAQKEWSKITANERGKLMIEAARNLKVLFLLIDLFNFLESFFWYVKCFL